MVILSQDLLIFSEGGHPFRSNRGRGRMIATNRSPCWRLFLHGQTNARGDRKDHLHKGEEEGLRQELERSALVLEHLERKKMLEFVKPTAIKA